MTKFAGNPSQQGSSHSNNDTVLLVNPPECVVQTDGSVHVSKESIQVRRIESCFGSPIEEKSSTGAMKHKDNVAGDQTAIELEERSLSVVTNETNALAASYDVSKEYGYKYEYTNAVETDEATSGINNNNEAEYGDDDDDDDDDGDILNRYDDVPAISQHAEAVMTTAENLPLVYLLGKTYHPIHQHETHKDYESSLFWFTYRCDFPSIEPYKITSDAGFGCMLRSAQMMLGQALRMHFQSRHWKPPKDLSKRRDDPFMKKLYTWFADYPGKEYIYSVHNMIAAGLQYEVLPGEWYGPGTACFVLRDLVRMHSKQNHHDLFRVHVASESTVYRDAVYELMTVESRKRAEEREKDNKETLAPAAHPLDLCLPDPHEESNKLRDLEWDTGLLLLIPLRLGLDHFNGKYAKYLSQTFSFPQSVGVLGGRPRGARWFYGAYGDGSKVLGLDPHTVQSTPKKRPPQLGQSDATAIDASDDHMHSMHTLYPEIFPILRMDPSLALAFYCRDKRDFVELEASFKAMKGSSNACPDLFTYVDRAPDYLSSAMNDMMLGGSADLDDDLDDGDSDEDDFVML